MSDSDPDLRKQFELTLRFYGVPAIGITDCARVARAAIDTAVAAERRKWASAFALASLEEEP